MKDTIVWYVGGLIASGVFFLGLGMRIAPVRAQEVEKPALPRQWRAALVQGDNSTYISDSQVDVVETSGACIYLVHTGARDGDAGLTSHIVLKKDLGAGRGC